MHREHHVLVHLAKLGHELARGQHKTHLPAGDVAGLAKAADHHAALGQCGHADGNLEAEIGILAELDRVHLAVERGVQQLLDRIARLLAQPRALLREVEGLELRPLTGNDV